MAAPPDRRTGFSRRRQYGLFAGYVAAVAGAIVGGFLLIASSFDPAFFAALRMTAASATVPVSAGAAAIVDAAATVPEAVSHHFFVMRENAALRDEVTRDRRVLARARAVAFENRRLRTLLHLTAQSEDVVATARLVSSTAASGRRYALLDAGRWQGVRPGMPVRATEGLVGRVVETGPAVARVLLLTDPDSIVPVRRTRDGLPAIVAGRGDGLVDVRMVGGANARFAAGDLFVTSGAGGVYASGIPVVAVQRRGADSITVAPIVSPATFDVAMVERAAPPPPLPAATVAAP